MDGDAAAGLAVASTLASKTAVAPTTPPATKEPDAPPTPPMLAERGEIGAKEVANASLQEKKGKKKKGKEVRAGLDLPVQCAL